MNSMHVCMCVHVYTYMYMYVCVRSRATVEGSLKEVDSIGRGA